ncbi:hypothetical protein JTB14_034861 [Gonioctena quinquepunctata]|nr:hypothetical protein JTB14_034861 [Gonioctena quinquepunctata]
MGQLTVPDKAHMKVPNKPPGPHLEHNLSGVHLRLLYFRYVKMPRKRALWSEEQLKQAMEAVGGGMAVGTARPYSEYQEEYCETIFHLQNRLHSNSRGGK